MTASSNQQPAANPYDTPVRQTGRRIITYPLRQPDPGLQPALDFSPPQPADPELTIQARFWTFHQANPHIYRELYRLACELRDAGETRLRTKMLFELLRGKTHTTGEGGYQLNNVFTPYYADLLAAEPALAAMHIERRQRKAA